MILKLRSAVSIITCSCLFGTASAIPSNIGIVMTPGEIVVDGSSVRGNCVLFAGTVVNSGDTASDLKFTDGAHALLQPDSTIKVYREHAILESGAVVQHESGRHALIADGLSVSSSMKDAIALVRVKDGSHFEVSAQAGEIEIRTASGNLVARVENGTSRSFTLGAAGQDISAVKLEGILRQDPAGRFLLTDTQTNVTYQLRGTGLQQLVGSSVTISGRVTAGSPTEDTPQIVQVTDISALGRSGGTSAAATGAAPAGSGSILTVTSVVLAVAVAAGGTLVGLAATGALGGGSTPATPVTP
jgi:hypothetical protein